MKFHPRPARSRRPIGITRTLVLTAAAAAASGTAMGQASPYYVGVSQALSIESNLGRLRDGASLQNTLLKKRSDTISSTTLIAGFDQPISRQRVQGSVRLSANRFASNQDFNNESYAANLGLDWETVNRLSGTAAVSSQRNLRKFDPNEAGGRQAQNLETVNQVDLSARIGGPTRLTGRLGVNWRQVDYSAATYSAAEYDQTTLSAGLLYRTSSALQLGTALRTGNTRYNRAGDDRRRNDLDFTADWRPSGDLTTVFGRISYTSIAYDLATLGDFRGLSAEARVNWRVTGKTRLTGRLVHDAGQEASFLNSSGTSPISQDYSRTSTTLFVGADHALSAKIQLNAGLGLVRRNLTDSFYSVAGVPAEGNDLTTTLSLGARWQPTRAIQLGCDASYERRTTSTGAVVTGRFVSEPYANNTLSCFGQFVLERL